ncbi:MAG: arsenosugar biosynthesis radical SAM protein ArsS [Planctomycetes bacterium]|nr:arsenosugar biosynthesis radical SAM protein ArsS [Planctomycetota bacterium]
MLDLPIHQPASAPPCSQRYDFPTVIERHRMRLPPVSVETLQVNITKLCNQACHHCHVDASPKRTEQMDHRTIDRCLEVLAANPAVKNLDITGGAPELNPHFDHLVTSACKLGKHVMVRHNLTVTFDGNPQTGESKRYLPEFFARNQVEVISSLPYYQEFFTDKQRGKGVFQKSLESMRLLNRQGYGEEGTGLVINLVYNPVGAFLPASQKSLEQDFKRELVSRHGLVFNQLYAITNMPIHRFKDFLERSGNYDDYMTRLINAFNPQAALGVMCRSLVSVGYDGRLYDCDFNQMLEMQITNGTARTIFDFNLKELLSREILFASHCFGCTAGAGSGCGGNTA